MSLQAGKISFKVGGVAYLCAGSFTYSGQTTVRETLLGHDSVHGHKELPVAPFIEGVIRDTSTVDLDALWAVEGETVTLELANGKVFMLKGANFVGESAPETENGTVPVRFEGNKGAFV